MILAIEKVELNEVKFKELQITFCQMNQHHNVHFLIRDKNSQTGPVRLVATNCIL